ncbi:E3 ubiquitin-protein ligase TRIM39-like [Elgaria multicarinata webbii]|uniref:E3 ubiquitin-protein ligase TRIM39-like n=1 Tax=Elgaria multicarinata webbii TaxID=159646 RepID=UPI002FCD41EA
MSGLSLWWDPKELCKGLWTFTTASVLQWQKEPEAGTNVFPLQFLFSESSSQEAGGAQGQREEPRPSAFLPEAAMAAPGSDRALHEELFCPICLDYFTEPVILNCEHNFCQACISTYWAGLGDSFLCPQCRKRSRKRTLRPNTQLGKVAARAKELASTSAQPGAAPGWAPKAGGGCGGCGSHHPEGPEGMCKKHLEALKLFCRDDEALICVVYDRSKDHRAHAVVPVEEAAEEYKVQFQHHLAMLKSERDSREILAVNQGRRLEMLLGRAEAKRKHTTHMFQQLQRVLQYRESHILQGLSKVTTDLKKMQQENSHKVQQGAPLLQGLILELEQKCQQPDTEFLKDVGILLNRCKNWNFPKWTPMSTTELEERIFHFSRKKTVLWEHMTEMREILTLDPDSAHPNLAISADQRTVSRQGACPANRNTSQRFHPSFCVLGSEGFTDGCHHWLVDVKGQCGWALGVAQESVERKRPVVLQPERGIWAVELGPYQLHQAAPASNAEAGIPSRRILVSLDYEAGRLAFSDSQKSEPLFTFRASFKEKLYPFFWLWSPEASITLCP